MEARSYLKIVYKLDIQAGMSNADIKKLLFFKEVKSMHITFKIGCDLITFYPIFNSLLLVLVKGFEFLFLHCCSLPPK